MLLAYVEYVLNWIVCVLLLFCRDVFFSLFYDCVLLCAFVWCFVLLCVRVLCDCVGFECGCVCGRLRVFMCAL